MTRLLFFLPFFTLFLSAGDFKRLELNEMQDIVVIEENYDIYDSKGRVARFYQETRSGDLRHLFNLTLKDKTGTCSAQSIEEGTYEVNGTTLTLYTSWERQGRIYDVPYGFRVMQYRMDENGTVERIRSRLYVETTQKSFDTESAMRFLWENPKNKADRKAFADYVGNVERQYKGSFVFGDEAKALKKEVQKALDRKMAKRWR